MKKQLMCGLCLLIFFQTHNLVRAEDKVTGRDGGGESKIDLEKKRIKDFNERNHEDEIRKVFERVKNCSSGSCSREEEYSLVNSFWNAMLLELNQHSWMCDDGSSIRLMQASNKADIQNELVVMSECMAEGARMRKLANRLCLEKTFHLQGVCDKLLNFSQAEQRRINLLMKYKSRGY